MKHHLAMENTEIELLRDILENIHTPESLDGHPWVSSLFVRDMVAKHQHLGQAGGGRQLAAALAELFASTRPSTPPRRGKRLDTRWGEFGLLAALYFAPVQFGAPAPTSLRDAWGRIDSSILLYVNGHEGKGIGIDTDRLREMYGLVSPEPEVAPISTLSDWHRKGIQRLAEAVLARETYLEELPVTAPRQASSSKKPGWFRRAFLPVLALLVCALAGFGIYKGRQIYDQGMILREDISELRGAAASPADLKALAGAGRLIAKTRQDFAAFQSEVEPFLWLGPRLGWVPVYGGDLASSPELLQLASRLLESADTAVAASRPLVVLLERDASPNPSEVVALLQQIQPDLSQARSALDRAIQLRAGLDLERLSPLTRSLIEEELDRLLPMLDEGLAAGTALPQLLGATSEGPKTYLLLAQNEDELRPTGGFITAVGTMVLQDGQVLSLSFVDSGELDNWEKPYPLAPWQLEQYMNSPVLLLRDANWFPDFPTSALYAESLYAYSKSHSVDGVIAFDQHMLVLLLDALGPLEVEGASDPIDAGNVIAYMRSAKTRPTDQPAAAEWSPKSFMDKITRAMLLKIFEGQDVSWESLGSALLQSLDQNHLLVQLDDPTAAAVIARHGWDGALRYEEGDFVMVVDSNVGFNKTNAVVQTSLAYDIDLSDPAAPAGTLTVTHVNNAAADVPCIHWGAERLAGQQAYPIDACYWDYMRVYVPAGAELLEATPQSVPAAWMLLGRGVKGPVDVLDEEELDGLRGFGALMVIPGGESGMMSFQFRLPGQVVLTEGDRTTYRLRVEKQPGTIAIPIIIRVHLPNGATVESSVPDAIVEGNDLYLETNLSADLDLTVDFRLK